MSAPTGASTPPARYDDLRAVFVNCTLKPGTQRSHTGLLMNVSARIMAEQGVQVDRIRAADHAIAAGVQPDMTRHGAPRDDWPALWQRIAAADILVIGSPIWLGEKSSVCQRVIERLYAQSGQVNSRGQYVYYGKVGGCLVTGNEDGIKHVAMGVLYALQHLGCVIPPQADAGWIGEAGPGPSYGDEGPDQRPVGFDNDFTRRNTTFMTWNLLHCARMLKDAGGVPAYGNQRSGWDDGERYGYENPEYR